MKLKNSQIAVMWQAIQAVYAMKTEGPVSWNYALASNKRKLQPIIESFKEAQKLPPELDAWHQAHRKLLQAMSRAPMPGEIFPPGHVPITDAAAWDAAIAKLREQFPPDTEDQIKKREQEYEALMNGETELALVTCPMEKVPPLPAHLVDSLFDMISP